MGLAGGGVVDCECTAELADLAHRQSSTVLSARARKTARFKPWDKIAGRQRLTW